MSKRKRFEFGYNRGSLTAEEFKADLRSSRLEARASQMLLDAYPEERPFRAPKARRVQPEGDKQRFPEINDSNRAQWQARIKKLNPWVKFNQEIRQTA